MLENAVVGLVVLGCAVFSAWRLMPVQLRLKVLDGLEPVVGRALLSRLRARALAQLAGGCGACASKGRTVKH